MASASKFGKSWSPKMILFWGLALIFLGGTNSRTGGVSGFFQGVQVPSFSQSIQEGSALDFFSTNKSKNKALEIEDALLEAIHGKDNRLSNDEEIDALVQRLEDSGCGIPRPAIAPQVYGSWKLLHTTNADTSSPIQRKAVDASQYQIYQNIIVRDSDNKLVVSQIVKFGENTQLVVDALASTSAYPLPELDERQRDGTILGFNILGVSKIGEEAAEDINRPDSRINFVFDEGNFNIGSFKVPYPVPFRSPLFRDAVKGWIDITYLSQRIRIARGNKGTTFVLRKED